MLLFEILQHIVGYCVIALCQLIYMIESMIQGRNKHTDNFWKMLLVCSGYERNISHYLWAAYSTFCEDMVLPLPTSFPPCYVSLHVCVTDSRSRYWRDLLTELGTQLRDHIQNPSWLAMLYDLHRRDAMPCKIVAVDEWPDQVSSNITYYYSTLILIYYISFSYIPVGQWFWPYESYSIRGLH